MLNKHLETAKRAFMHVSFSPEKRGEDTIRFYSRELAEDLEVLKQKGTVGNYQEKYEYHFLKWLSAQSRCFSFLITGSGNFPVARHAKTLKAEKSAYDKFRAWREGYFKAVNRQRTLSPEEELDKALMMLDKQTAFHETMKACNKIMQKKGIETADKLHEIRKVFGDKIYQMVLEIGDMYRRHGAEDYSFRGFMLTNSNAKIKSLKDKVEIMKKRIERKESFEPINFDGGSIDIEADRVVIRHGKKPDNAVIDALKARGFRWSGRHVCWCRKHTGQALIDAKRICGVEL